MTVRTVCAWKEDLLGSYQVRKTRRQKDAFLAHLAEIYGERMQVEASGRLVKSRNVVIGNPDTASVIFGAHYDTCARLPFPNFITPKNFPLFVLYQLFIAFLLLVPAFVLSALTAAVTRSLLLTELVLFAVFAVFLWLLLAGPANPHTANDNTSGVVAVLSLADRLLASGREDVCFVLFDNEEAGLFGSMAFAKKHRTARDRVLVVNFDCVSDGDWLMLLSSGSVRRRAAYGAFCEYVRKACASTEKLPLFASSGTTLYPSDQVNFRKYIAVAALKRTKTRLIGYYMNRIHTPRDVVFDERNLCLLVDIFSRLPEFGM
ncbi:MAG: M28 family metallopeptidase [Eubacteriales bacterium]